MSYEAWGDDDPQELPDGWWDDEQVSSVVDIVKALRGEQVYQNGRMEEGISERFLARLTMLSDACGLMEGMRERDVMVADAERVLSTDSGA